MFSKLDALLNNEIRYPFYIRGRSDVIFIHIIKSAGTSIVRSLKFNPPDPGKNMFKHWHAREIEHAIGKDKWNAAFKITFVRNPWERMISYYRYMKNRDDTHLGNHPIDFKPWLAKTIGPNPDFHYEGHLGRLYKPQVYWLKDKTGMVNMDFIGRFENLAADFESLCKRLETSVPNLPHTNSSGQPVNVSDWYDDESRALVDHFYKEDIDYFNYNFEEQ